MAQGRLADRARPEPRRAGRLRSSPSTAGRPPRSARAARAAWRRPARGRAAASRARTAGGVPSRLRTQSGASSIRSKVVKRPGSAGTRAGGARPRGLGHAGTRAPGCRSDRRTGSSRGRPPVREDPPDLACPIATARQIGWQRHRTDASETPELALARAAVRLEAAAQDDAREPAAEQQEGHGAEHDDRRGNGARAVRRRVDQPVPAGRWRSTPPPVAVSDWVGVRLCCVRCGFTCAAARGLRRIAIAIRIAESELE